MSEVDVNAAMDEQVSADLIKAAADADLIPGGRYRFQVESYEGSVADKEYFDEEQKNRNPFYGKTLYNLRLSLTSVRDAKGKDAAYTKLDRPRTIFQRVTNATVLDRRGELSIESKLFGHMASIVSAATGSSPTVRQTLDWFKDNAGEITITKTDEKTTDDGKHYDAKNWVRGIKPVPAGV